MNKFIERIKVLTSKRSFWINAIGGAIVFLNETNGQIIPTKYAAEILVFLNIANRFVKVINEEQSK